MKTRTQQTRKSRLSSAIKIALATVMCLVIWTWGVLPARNYMSQRTEVVALTEELAERRAANADLEQEIERLSTDEEVERMAREDFNLVYPGEEAYLILPAPPQSIRLRARQARPAENQGHAWHNPRTSFVRGR